MRTLSTEEKQTAVRHIVDEIYYLFMQAEASKEDAIELRSEVGSKFHAKAIEAKRQLDEGEA